jgi:spore coat protein A
VGIDAEISKRSKIIKVPNDQNPGTLFYHDHAMKSTRYNVQNGLAGIYIIYDKYV